MSRKAKVLISLLAAVLLLTVSAAATVMAEGEEEETTPPAEAAEGSLMNRVADILGIEKEDLISAFEQAQQEIREEDFISRINEAVEEERITQEQADEIIEWWLEKPDDAIKAWRGQRPNIIGPSMFKNAPRFRFSFGSRRGNCFG